MAKRDVKLRRFAVMYSAGEKSSRVNLNRGSVLIYPRRFTVKNKIEPPRISRKDGKLI